MLFIQQLPFFFHDKLMACHKRLYKIVISPDAIKIPVFQERFYAFDYEKCSTRLHCPSEIL